MSDKSMYPPTGGRAATAPGTDLSEPVARIVREELKVIEEEMLAELRAQPQRRTVKMNAGATAASLYAGGALAVAVGLLLALVLPAWAAFLIVAAGLFGLALAFRAAARARGRTRRTADTVSGESPPLGQPTGLGPGVGAGPIPPGPGMAPTQGVNPGGAPHHRA
ncbi:phage holin family protein [Streptomyces sp. NPDC048172]|uniref:phage holin family protein n=1 Tax=Streptomyces sp. NPDC048172 TaxID=3365505 RepID=UPI003716C39A